MHNFYSNTEYSVYAHKVQNPLDMENQLFFSKDDSYSLNESTEIYFESYDGTLEGIGGRIFP